MIAGLVAITGSIALVVAAAWVAKKAEERDNRSEETKSYPQAVVLLNLSVTIYRLSDGKWAARVMCGDEQIEGRVWGSEEEARTAARNAVVGVIVKEQG